MAELHAFVELLRQGHGALGRIAQPVVRCLLQFRSRERRRRVAPLFLLRHRCHLPAGLAHRGNDCVRSLLILDLDVRVVVLDELRLEQRRLSRIQHRVDGPVLLRHERADGFLAVNDQPQSYGLHASGGQPAPDLVPQKRRDFVPHQPVEDPAGLLRVHETVVQVPGVVKRRADGFGGNFIEGDPKDLLRVGRGNIVGQIPVASPPLASFRVRRFLGFASLAILLPGSLGLDEPAGLREHHRQMRRNGFSLAVRVRSQIDGVGGMGRLAQIVDDLAFAGDDLQRRLENLFIIQSNFGCFCLDFRAFLRAFFLLRAFLARGIIARQANPDGLGRQVHHVADGRLDGVIPSQVFVNRLRLRGRFDNDKRTSHVTFVTPVCISERADCGACVFLATFGASPSRWGPAECEMHLPAIPVHCS